MKAVRESSIISEENGKFLGLFEKNWWFLSFIFGLNIGCRLYESKDRDNHVVIVNNTNHPFITSDHPIINVHSSLESISEKQDPESADFYIPLSRRYAYMINNSSNYNYLAPSISIEEVENFNRKIAEKSYVTIFGSTEDVLKTYNKLKRT